VTNTFVVHCEGSRICHIETTGCPFLSPPTQIIRHGASSLQFDVPCACRRQSTATGHAAWSHPAEAAAATVVTARLRQWRYRQGSLPPHAPPHIHLSQHFHLLRRSSDSSSDSANGRGCRSCTDAHTLPLRPRPSAAAITDAASLCLQCHYHGVTTCAERPPRWGGVEREERLGDASGCICSDLRQTNRIRVLFTSAFADDTRIVCAPC
jgi:hypothetical protein